MNQSIDLTGLMFLAAKASLMAGEAILEVYQSDFAIEHKEDRSPLTLADKRSHEVIMHRLINSGIPVLSEEGKDISYDERKTWEYFWLVDPLDGTKEFIKRNGEFTVNIALIHNGRPILGVVYVPFNDTLYYSSETTGAWKLTSASETLNELSVESKAAKLPLARKEGRPYTVIASRSHMSKETEEYLDKLRAEHGEIDLISAGSSLKLCLVAEGAADEYPRFGPTMEWDTAAGQAIVEGAGRKVLSLDTHEPLKYNKEHLLNPFFMVIT